MKNRFLLCSLFVLFTLSLSPLWRILSILVFALYWYLRFRDRTFLFVIMINLIFLIEGMIPVSARFPSQGIVEEVRQYNIVIKSGNQLYLCERLPDVRIDDILSLEGEIIPWNDAISYFSPSQRQIYESQGISARIKVNFWQKTGERHTIRRKLYDQIIAQSENTAANYLEWALFHAESGEEGGMTLNDALRSSGIFLSGAFSLLSELLHLIFLPFAADLISIAVMILLGMRTHFSCTLFRIILQKLLLNLPENDDRVGGLILLLLLLNPSYRFSLSFQIPICLRILSLYSKERHLWDASLALLPVQLNSFYSIDLISSFLYPLYRRLLLVTCFLSSITLLFPNPVFQWMLNLLLPLLQPLPIQLKLSGKPGIILLILYETILSEYFHSRRAKILLPLGLILCLTQFQTALLPYSEAVFLNVSHGDCFLYHDAFSNRVLMIDTGSSYQYSKVKNYLNAKGIRRIDMLILSHADEDHSGNAESLKNDFDVGEVIDTKREEVSFHKHVLLGLLADHAFEEENSNSQIYLCNLDGLNYLFTGDMTKETEEAFLKEVPKISVDILKVAHHGSDTSSSERFLSRIYPRLAVISCNRNYYHLPSNEVLERFLLLKIPTLRTDEEGDIRIVSFLNCHLLTSSAHLFYFIR